MENDIKTGLLAWLLLYGRSWHSGAAGYKDTFGSAGLCLDAFHAGYLEVRQLPNTAADFRISDKGMELLNG